MAGRGPAPKTERSRPNDTARRQAEFKHLVADGVLRGFDLPSNVPWTERTKAWWQNWRESPLAGTFIEADWDFLLDTALLHNELWSGNTGVAAELRQRVSKFGATPEDRLRLRLEVSKDVEDAPKPQRMTNDRRERLLAIVES
jgi:hypothetical protein